jgi:murein DD-endopeptidase MepM/ murein hydrolase activator NlpD
LFSFCACLVRFRLRRFGSEDSRSSRVVYRNKYANVWQKMLMEQAEEKAREAEQRRLADLGRMVEARQLDYDLGSLPDPGVTASPRLGYDMGSLDGYGPVEGTVTDDGKEYNEHDIVVNGRQRIYPRGSIAAQCDGEVMRGMTGWQNPERHHGQGAGLGWRTWIACSDGSRVGYGHLDPNSTLTEGTPVRVGDPMGRMATPTNGRSTGPHVHQQEYDARGRLVAPTRGNPFLRPGHRRGRFGETDGLHRGRNYPGGHQGDDWIEE